MKMSIENHIVLGEAIKTYRSAISTALRGRRPSDPECAALIQMWGQVEEFRNALDNEICRRAPSHLDRSDDALRVYYGDPLDSEARARLMALEPTNVDAAATPAARGE